jgi:hypothetical protein
MFLIRKVSPRPFANPQNCPVISRFGIRCLWSDHTAGFAFPIRNESACGQISVYIGNWEWFKMAAKTRYGIDFVALRLTEEQKPQFLSWAEDNAPDAFTHIEHMVSDGYKISINMDANNDCVIVAVTGTDNNRTNRGLCMTSRAGDAIEALMMALYKHIILCDGGSWGDIEQRASDWG